MKIPPRRCSMRTGGQTWRSKQSPFSIFWTRLTTVDKTRWQKKVPLQNQLLNVYR